MYLAEPVPQHLLNLLRLAVFPLSMGVSVDAFLCPDAGVCGFASFAAGQIWPQPSRPFLAPHEHAAHLLGDFIRAGTVLLE